MRSHAKASTAGSKPQGAARLALLAAFFAALLTLLVVVGTASATKTHLFKEVFGSSAQPSFTTPRGMAIDQGSGEVYVIDAGSPPSVKRYNPDGTPSNFSALSSNAIDGAGGADTTPQNGLSFASASESQIAVDNSGGATDGDIYVTQGSPNLINIFSSTGTYLGQLTKAGATNFSEACGVAVDPSGAVYVGDYTGGIRKFVPSANPVVNTDNTATFTTTTQPCTIAAGAGATAGFIFPARFSGAISKVDSSTGELKYTVSSESNTTVSVDPASGHVYGAAGSNLKEFDASGAGSATSISTTKLSSSAQGLGVRGSSGDIYLTRSGQANVQVYGPTVTIPDVVTSPPSSNTGVRATLAGTVNPDGVELDECFFQWGRATFQGGEGIAESTVPCAETPAEIGTGTSPVAVHVDINALQPNGATYQFRLVAVNPNGTVNGSNQNFTTPDTIVTEAATGVTPTEATLNGSVNPDGTAISECFFEWGPEKGPFDETQEYPETAQCVPSAAAIGTGTSPVAVQATIAGLHQGTIYHYRLRAANANGPIVGKDKSLQTAGPAIWESWTASASLSEASLRAKVNPEGAATTFHVEYGPTTAYGQGSEEANVGSDSSDHLLSVDLDGLQEGTTYHYRVVASSAVATNEGPDRTFTTYRYFVPKGDCPNQSLRAAAASNLPDCRGYEMVSPVDKGGSDITAYTDLSGSFSLAYDQSDLTGDRLTYTAHERFADGVSKPYQPQYIASRGAQGEWSSHGISPPRGIVSAGGPTAGTQNEFKLFSSDLCTAWLINDVTTEAPLAAGGWENASNLYRRSNCGEESYAALAAPVDVGGRPRAVSSDGSKLVFAAIQHLTQDGPTGIGPGLSARCNPTTDGGLPGVARQWLRDGAPIGGATGEQYVFTAADEGSAIQCQITVSGAGAGTTQVNNPVFVIAPYPPTAPPRAPARVAAPEQSAPLDVGGPGGQMLSCDAGEWDGSPSFSYRWYRNGVQLAGETGASHTVSAGDLASPAALQCAVVATNAGGSVVAVSANRLTSPPPGEPPVPSIGVEARDSKAQVYLSDGGGLRRVCVLPDGGVPANGCAVGWAEEAGEVQESNLARAFSADGSRLFWSVKASNGVPKDLYVRENPAEPQSALDGGGECTEPGKACTIEIPTDEPATFLTAAADGSKMLYRTGTPRDQSTSGDLYEFDARSHASHLIAGGVTGMLGASEDASRLYFASIEVLSGGQQNSEGDAAQAGRPNLYLYEEGAFTFIATLSSEDGAISPPFFTAGSPVAIKPDWHLGRVTPDGGTAAFMARTPLTGYDNTDLNSGEADFEVFRYDAASGRLVCVSCNPGGARPVGSPRWNRKRESWTAARIPSLDTGLHSRRVLSEDGMRLFFDSYDPLVLRDTDGHRDVYEWEAQGSGDCGSESATFSRETGGCVSLVSSGTSREGGSEFAEDSEFVEASPDGSNVFFRTAASLLPKDPGLIDIYDAREGGGTPAPAAAPVCEGDSCQSPPPSPGVKAPASAGFRGGGNLHPLRNCRATAVRAVRVGHRAKRLRHRARQVDSARRTRRLRRRSAHLAKRAKGLSRSAARCRRANRRAAR